MQVWPTELPGVVLIEPDIFGDARGFFLETWHQSRYAAAGIPVEFVQDNLSFSAQGVLRGLHYQYPSAQGKLVYVLQGEVFDVAVDIRADSPTFGRWTGVTLSGENKRQLFIPAGFAHGFCVTSETVLFAYKCTDYYSPRAEAGIRWNDPDIAVKWPVDRPILSDKDKQYALLKEIPAERLPRVE